MGDVNITYETLFELLRREKTRDELQKLDESFFLDVASYIKDKVDLLEEQRHKQDLFASEEKAKAEKQIENIRRIIKELYERREKKIIEMAIDASRTPSIVIDTSIMLKEEKQMYDNTLGLLNGFRKGVLFNIQQAKNPEIKEVAAEIQAEESKSETPAVEAELREVDEDIKKIKITHEIPKFIGSDLNEYGPFQAGDEADVPPKIADVLINKGRAE